MTLAAVAEEWEHQAALGLCFALVAGAEIVKTSYLPRRWDMLGWAQVVSVENKIKLRVYRYAG